MIFAHDRPDHPVWMLQGSVLIRFPEDVQAVEGAYWSKIHPCAEGLEQSPEWWIFEPVHLSDCHVWITWQSDGGTYKDGHPHLTGVYEVDDERVRWPFRNPWGVPAERWWRRLLSEPYVHLLVDTPYPDEEEVP